MLGAIAGDIIGSVHEFHKVGRFDFPLFDGRQFFTDDSVLTVALADSMMSETPYVDKLKEYHRRYPGAGWGGNFNHWASTDDRRPYNSFGNGSAMRVSPVAFAYDDLDTVLAEARRSAEVTHNHPEGIKGAQATAAAIFWARQKCSKAYIRQEIETRFGYRLDDTVDNLRQTYSFDESCQRTVPQALICFLESSDFEDSVRKAIWIGGDADTLACIVGGIAEAFYGGVPAPVREKVFEILDERLAGIVRAFYRRYLPGVLD